MKKEIAKKIIEAGTCAPSGDNSQPWKFKVEGDTVSIFNLPNRDNPILNVRQRGSLVAHGGLIENMVIAASILGFVVNLDTLPANQSSNLVAILRFSKGVSRKDPLYPFILKRATNRKPYTKQLLNSEQRTAILGVAGDIKVTIKLIENDKQKRIIAEALSITERVALEMKDLHRLFFTDIVWTEEEELQKKRGLFIKTLELPLPIELLFRVIRYWPLMCVLNSLGFAKLAARGNAQIYAASAAIGIIAVNDEDGDFITAGRIMQRIWLEVTRLDLSLQPVTGLLFLAQRVMNDGKGFSPHHKKLIQDAYNKVKSMFGIDDTLLPAMLFRVGKADPPSARSSRLSPKIFFSEGDK